MAQTFDGAQYPDAKRFALSGSVNNTTEIVVPSSATTATVRFETNAGALSFEGTDNTTVNANYIIVTADATHQFSLGDGFNVSKGVTSFFVSSPTASNVVSVMVEG